MADSYVTVDCRDLAGADCTAYIIPMPGIMFIMGHICMGFIIME
jgi:uncharacterized membrane protein YgdD (TMEM256/DUF423 family)